VAYSRPWSRPWWRTEGLGADLGGVLKAFCMMRGPSSPRRRRSPSPEAGFSWSACSAGAADRKRDSTPSRVPSASLQDLRPRFLAAFSKTRLSAYYASAVSGHCPRLRRRPRVGASRDRLARELCDYPRVEDGAQNRTPAQPSLRRVAPPMHSARSWANRNVNTAFIVQKRQSFLRHRAAAHRGSRRRGRFIVVVDDAAPRGAFCWRVGRRCCPPGSCGDFQEGVQRRCEERARSSGVFHCEKYRLGYEVPS